MNKSVFPFTLPRFQRWLLARWIRRRLRAVDPMTAEALTDDELLSERWWRDEQ